MGQEYNETKNTEPAHELNDKMWPSHSANQREGANIVGGTHCKMFLDAKSMTMAGVVDDFVFLCVPIFTAPIPMTKIN